MNRATKIALGTGASLVVAALSWLALTNASGRFGGGRAGQEGGAAVAALRGMDATPGTEGMAGMDMSAGTPGGSVALSPQDAAALGITFGSAEVRPLARNVRAVGLVEVDETRVAYVSPKFAGWAERLHADFTGQRVRQGEPLLDVYAPELVNAQEELLLATRMLDSLRGSRVESVASAARELRASARRRLEYWDISDDQIERLLATGEVSRTLTLHAPASGVVTEKRVFVGQSFASGTTLYTITDLSRVWVNAEVFEADAALMRVGMSVDVTVAALPQRELAGRIEYVYPTLEDRTRTVRARVALANPGGQLKPGMYATVRLRVDLGEALTVPASAILNTGERAVTFVDMGGGTLMPQELEVGLRGGDFVQVLSGVEPGQRVVTSAQFLLDSESNLAEVMRAMMAQMSLSDLGGR